MIAFIGFLRTFISQSKIKAWIIQRRRAGNLFAALFGAVTPFVPVPYPIFLGFLEAGIPGDNFILDHLSAYQ